MQLPWALLPALLLKAGVSAARSTDAALSRGLERSLKHHTARPPERGGGGGDKRHYIGEATVHGSLGDVLELFEEFAVEELHSWRKVSAHVDAGGRAEAIFSGQFSFPVHLTPNSARSRMRAGIEACNGGPISPITNVPYRYVVRFQFEPVGDRVHVTQHTTETVAPYGLSEHDVSYHYEAPQLPRGVGAVGDRFLDLVRGFGPGSS
jgi:hypothetical protein